jgi:hypothetical protein
VHSGVRQERGLLSIVGVPVMMNTVMSGMECQMLSRCGVLVDQAELHLFFVHPTFPFVNVCDDKRGQIKALKSVTLSEGD